LKQTERIDRPCALARANRDFGTDKSKDSLGLLLPKIADGARMCFSSVRHRRSARTGRRPRKFERHSSMYPATSADVGERPLRAPRANRVFGTDMKRIRTKDTVMDKSKGGLGWFFLQDRRLRADGFSSAQQRNSAICNR
jgi:hypothetical protein